MRCNYHGTTMGGKTFIGSHGSVIFCVETIAPMGVSAFFKINPSSHDNPMVVMVGIFYVFFVTPLDVRGHQ